MPRVGELSSERLHNDTAGRRMAAYFVLSQQVHDLDRYRAESLNDREYRPVKEVRLSVTSRGYAVVAPEFVPAG